MDDGDIVEGLGPATERTFLDGRLPQWRHAARGVVLPPGFIAAPAAVEAALALGGGADVRAVPQGRVCSPGAAILVPHGGGPVDAGRWQAATERGFDAKEHELPWAGEKLVVADAWMFHVTHWVDLLWANLLALGPWLWGELSAPWRVAWAAIRAGSLRPEAVAGGLVRRGPEAWVHPAATVEFSVLGPGARIGAGAVVRGCVLGEGAVVEELAMVEGCVIGAGAKIQRQAMAKFSVVESGAAHAGVLQLGVLGAGAQVRQGAVCFDQSLGAPVRFKRAGQLQVAPRGMLGVCVGPGACLGQGVRVAAGRVVPAGVTVLPDPASVLHRVELPAGVQRARVHDGGLEAVSGGGGDAVG